MIQKPINWIGKSGKKYPYNKYLNHGYGGIKQGFKDLPKEDYPYSIEYAKQLILNTHETTKGESNRINRIF